PPGGRPGPGAPPARAGGAGRDCRRRSGRSSGSRGRPAGARTRRPSPSRRSPRSPGSPRRRRGGRRGRGAGDPRASGALSPGPQRPVDRLLEVVGRQCAGEPPPVHEEHRRRVDAERARFLHVRVDRVLRLLPSKHSWNFGTSSPPALAVSPALFFWLSLVISASLGPRSGWLSSEILLMVCSSGSTVRSVRSPRKE